MAAPFAVNCRLRAERYGPSHNPSHGQHDNATPDDATPGESRSDADRMAHDDIARKLALFCRRDHDVAKRSDAGVDAVGTHIVLDQRLHQPVRRPNPAEGGRRQRQRGSLVADCTYLLPGEREIDLELETHCFGAAGAARARAPSRVP